jgi:hypothetical protein
LNGYNFGGNLKRYGSVLRELQGFKYTRDFNFFIKIMIFLLDFFIGQVGLEWMCSGWQWFGGCGYLIGNV